MINYDEELRKIFGGKYVGCTQRDDELVEYQLKPDEVATTEELALVDALPKGMRSEFAELKAKVAEIDELRAGQDEIKGKFNLLLEKLKEAKDGT